MRITQGGNAMTIGEKIRLARTEQGLSQRQLCADQITRNMLSLIENGSARPSMDTLSYLAQRLGKPISYFLNENAATTPNAAVMEAARAAFAAGDHAGVVAALADYHSPDPIFDTERGMLENISRLSLANQAVHREQLPLAAQLLDKIDQKNLYFSAIAREFWMACRFLPPADDRELLLRAEDALQNGKPARALCYLQAAEDHRSPRWNLLCGRAYFFQKDYQNAIVCYQNAESSRPRESLEALENCYRELGDFENAYRCACKLREM